MKLILIRHGQSQWNLENRFTGWQDVDITELGKREAHMAGMLLKGEKIDVSFSSTLIRANHTLSIIQEVCGLKEIPVYRHQAFNERCYGDLEGLNKDETAQQYGKEQVHIWRRSFETAPPNGESLKDTCDRVIPYFESHVRPVLRERKNVLIVAHGNSLRALIMYLKKLSAQEILQWEIATGKPLIYIFDDECKNDGKFETVTSNWISSLDGQ